MDSNYFGVFRQHAIKHENDYAIECLRERGFYVIKNVLNAEEVDYGRKRLLEIKHQLDERYGLDYLRSINEECLVRYPMFDDSFFLRKIIFNESVHSLLKDYFIYGYYVLHLQNAILNMPHDNTRYDCKYPKRFHRDFAYLNYAVDKTPLALNVFFCFDDFSEENGSTVILPYSHKEEYFPSDDYIRENAINVSASAGSIILFDSMLIHKAGVNHTKNIRVGLNHVFTSPFIRQQINLKDFFAKNSNLLNSDFERKTMGLEIREYSSRDEFYAGRESKYL